MVKTLPEIVVAVSCVSDVVASVVWPVAVRFVVEAFWSDV